MKDIFYTYIQIYKYTFVRIHCTHIHSHVNRYIHLYSISREPNLYKTKLMGGKFKYIECKSTIPVEQSVGMNNRLEAMTVKYRI